MEKENKARVKLSFALNYVNNFEGRNLISVGKKIVIGTQNISTE